MTLVTDLLFMTSLGCLFICLSSKAEDHTYLPDQHPGHAASASFLTCPLFQESVYSL